MVLRCVRESSAIIFYCFWPLLPLSDHLVYGLISMFVVCTMLLSVYMVYVKLLAVTWNYTYRKLSSVNLSRWVWTSSRKRPLCGSILVSNHLPQTTTKSSLFGWSLTRRFDCIHFSVTFSRFLFVISCLEMQLHFFQRVAGERLGMREKQQSHTRTSRSR